MRYAMIINKKRCFGCNACTVACKQTNASLPGAFYTKVTVEEKGVFPASTVEYMPHICFHCDNAPCVEVCPTTASKKMADGTVQVDENACIGCESCIDACPYGARFYNDPDGQLTYWEGKGQDLYEKTRYGEIRLATVTKCTFCASRRERGMPPACVETCPGAARIFGDLDDPDSEISKAYKKHKPKPYKPEEGTKPRVFYID